jgi:4-amino-4-deoxy-L-arabinose transferase-like glycosyltransferase
MNDHSDNQIVHHHVVWIDLLLVAVICVAFFGYRLGSYVPLTEHEGFVSVTAEETLEGNWIVPHFNGQIRLEKTPLMYWAVAVCGAVFGGVNEFTTRLPSALAAGGIALLLTFWAGRMFGRLSGVMTGLATASTAGLLWQSHVGQADTLMTFFVTACFVCLYLALERIQMGRSSLGFMTLAWLAFALGMMAKGPVPAPAVILPIVCFLIWLGVAPRWESIANSAPAERIKTILAASFKSLWQNIRQMHVSLGILIFIAIVGAWAAAILFRVPNAMYRWYEEYVARCIGEFGTSRPFYFYIPQIFLLTLPWSIFLPVGLVLPFKKLLREKRFELMFVFLWLAVDFIFFSAVAGKRAHYILPIVPPAIVLSVAGMIYALEHWLSRKNILIASTLVILATGVGFVVGYGYVQTHYPNVVNGYRVIAMGLIFAELLAMVAWLRIHLLVSVTTITLASGLMFALIWPMVPKVIDVNRDPQIAAKLIEDAVNSEATIYSVGRAHPPLVFYFGRHMPQIPTDQEVAKIYFKADNKNLALAQIQEDTAERVMELVRSSERTYFVTSDVRFTVARGYAKNNNLKLYEILRIPGYYSDDKSLVLFSNYPKVETRPATTKPGS